MGHESAYMEVFVELGSPGASMEAYRYIWTCVYGSIGRNWLNWSVYGSIMPYHIWFVCGSIEEQGIPGMFVKVVKNMAYLVCLWKNWKTLNTWYICWILKNMAYQVCLWRTRHTWCFFRIIGGTLHITGTSVEVSVGHGIHGASIKLSVGHGIYLVRLWKY